MIGSSYGVNDAKVIRTLDLGNKCYKTKVLGPMVCIDRLSKVCSVAYVLVVRTLGLWDSFQDIPFHIVTLYIYDEGQTVFICMYVGGGRTNI